MIGLNAVDNQNYRVDGICTVIAEGTFDSRHIAVLPIRV